MELTLTSEFIDAKRALDYGLLSRVVPDADLDSEAMALARRIAGNPPKALRMAKRLVRECAQAGLSQALELSASMQAIMLSSDEHKTALHAFLDQANDRKTARAAHCAGTQ
jgi:enoyl-CoA hydratase/carnithine racemase